MRFSALGNRRVRAEGRGFTLIELLVVVALVAIASAGVAFSLRDGSQDRLDREGERLAAVLEAARAQSRASGVAVRWRAVPGGFVFEGMPLRNLPDRWLDSATMTLGGPPAVVLGPEPLIGPQQIVLTTAARPDRTLRIATDGLRPFAIADTATP